MEKGGKGNQGKGDGKDHGVWIHRTNDKKEKTQGEEQTQKLEIEFWPEEDYNIREKWGRDTEGKEKEDKHRKDDEVAMTESERINTPGKPQRKDGDGGEQSEGAKGIGSGQWARGKLVETEQESMEGIQRHQEKQDRDRRK